MSDIDAIMQEAASDQTHPDWFVSSDINYIRRNLSECGITAIARTAEGEAAGFFIIELPEGGAGTVHRKTQNYAIFFTNRVYFILWNKEKLSMTES